MRLIGYIMLHTTNLKPSCQMHFIPCSEVRSKVCSKVRSKAHSEVHSEVHSQLHVTAHSETAWLDAPYCTGWHTFSLLDYTLPSKISRQSQANLRICSNVHLQVFLNTLPSILWCTLASTCSSIPPIGLDGILPAYLSLYSKVHSSGDEG